MLRLAGDSGKKITGDVVVWGNFWEQLPIIFEIQFS